MLLSQMKSLALPILEYNLENQAPIELLDLTNSLVALGDEFKGYLQKHPGFGSPDELKLYVREVRTGSVVAHLVAFAPLLFSFAEHSNSVIEFGRYLSLAYKYLLNKSNDKPDTVEKRNYENLSRIVNPVAKDNGAILNVSTIIKGNVTYNVKLSSPEANIIQNTARREIERLKEPESRLREKVVMYWYQARNDFSNTAGDMGIIESISKSPKKIEFATEEIKRAMLYQEDPFRRAYVVDVEVETIRDQPVLYKIVSYHGTFGQFLGEDNQFSLDV